MRIEAKISPESTQEALSSDRLRKPRPDEVPISTGESKREARDLSSEEILDKIVGLTEEGVYSVRFERNDRTGKTVIRVVDRDSGEVIRQIPPEELLNVSKTLEDLRGLILDTEG